MNAKVYHRLSIMLLVLLFVPAYDGEREFERNAYYEYELVTTEQGLSQGLVMNILEDHRGYIWLATPGGLDRYDGVEFDHFYHNPADSNSLSLNEVNAMFEDLFGRLWLGMMDGEINVIDRERQNVHRIPSDTQLVDKRWGEIKTFREMPSGEIVFLDRLGRIGKISVGSDWSEVEALDS